MITATQESAVASASSVALKSQSVVVASSPAVETRAFRTEIAAPAAAYESDVLVQLKANLATLEDLHGRLHFMMGEISYLLKKS